MIKTGKIFKVYFFSYYKTLNIPEDASTQQIKKSFNQLAKKHHPDVGNISHDQFVKIKQAYDTLKNPDSRRQYDFERIHGKPSQRRKYYYYYGQSQTTNSSKKFVFLRAKILSSASIICMFILVFHLTNVYSVPMTEHEIRRQNIILANQNIDSSPSVQEKRRKMYLQEMKQKKITSRIITLKVSNSAQETTKAKNARKNSMQSIPGVKKQVTQVLQLPTQQYI